MSACRQGVVTAPRFQEPRRGVKRRRLRPARPADKEGITLSGIRTRPLWAAVVLLAIGGCVGRVGHEAGGPTASLLASPGAPASEVREGALHGGFITVRVRIPEATPRPVPAVLTLLGQEDAFLDLGLAVVTFETHWEVLKPLVDALPPPPAPEGPPPRTWGKWMLAAPSPRTVGQGYFGLIHGTATRTVPEILDWLATVPEVDGRRVGVVGTSTNGFTALEAAGAERRIVAAVALAACGDYHAFLEQSPLGLGGEEPFDPTPEYEATLRRQEPIRHPERVLHGALLMVNGAADHAVPIACARETARVFARAYHRAGTPERFRYVEIPDGTHDLGEEGIRQAMAWLYRWLLGPESRALGRSSR